MDLKTIERVETTEQYKAVRAKVNELIVEATEKGVLESEADNEYTQEIGRLSRLGARYETEHIAFKHIKVKKKITAHP
jgi:hypothetical protein